MFLLPGFFFCVFIFFALDSVVFLRKGFLCLLDFGFVFFLFTLVFVFFTRFFPMFFFF